MRRGNSWRSWAIRLRPAAFLFILYLLFDLTNLPPYFQVILGLHVLLLLLGILWACVAIAVQVGIKMEKAQSQERLQAAQRASETQQRRFLERLDHELKNPLLAIRLGTENLLTTNPPNQREVLESIKVEANRLSRLVTDLRKLSEIDTRSLETSEVDMNRLLAEVVELVQELPNGAERQIELRLPRAPWPLPLITADWDLLFLALYNLLENGVKFTEPGDTLEVRAREEKPDVVIEVADTGPGIRAKDMPHIWDELYRGSNTRAISGSGLGLPLVRTVIHRHGGTVSVDSRSGEGTIFTIRLPIKAGVTNR